MTKLLNNRFLSSLYTLATLLSMSWFLTIFDSLLTEVGMPARIEIIGYVAFAFLLELLVYFVISTLYKGFGANHLSALVLSLILVANLLAFFLSFYDPFLMHGKLFNALEIFWLVAVFYWLCFVLAEKRILVGALSLLYLAMVGQQMIGLAISKSPGEEVSTDNPLIRKFKNVKFEDKPNVYLISFDALMPTRNAIEYLGIGQPAYVSVLENNGARIFKNTYSDYSLTDDSLDTVLYLDPDIYRSTPHIIPVFSGLLPSPVYEIFRNNGYKINVARAGWHMLRGKYIDEFTPRVSRQSYCMLSRNWYYLQHLGYCAFKRSVINKYFKSYSEITLSFEEHVFDKFKKYSSTQQPWFNFVYIFSPGHAPRSYTRTEQELIDYRRYFTKNQKNTAQYIQMAIDHIKINDPTGIVLIFGDHGARLSGRLPLNKKNAQFVIRDRHGVVSAVYPGDICSSYLGKRDEKKFITPSGLVRQLITCLSGGDDPIDWEVDYSGPYKNHKFEDFLYE